ncbi:MAG: response regulator FixJ [Gammaproteobacteria bacterium]|nr:response regulator FixJ [Gammaproteobacteria bacterium]
MNKQEMTVHIIDDDPATRDSLQWLIEAEDYQVRTFSNALSFLDNLPDETVGCILTDIRMPEMSGLELYQALKEKSCSLPVIMITGHGDVAMAVNALKDGVYDFIEKPFDNRHLLERIEQALQQSLTTQEDLAARQEIEARFETLTKREQEVMDKIVQGLSNKEMALELDISIKTIEVHRSRVMEKMNAPSLASLVRMSINI